MYNLTTDEIQLLSYFSNLNEFNQDKILNLCISTLNEQIIEEAIRTTLISVSTKKDSRSNPQK